MGLQQLTPATVAVAISIPKITIMRSLLKSSCVACQMTNPWKEWNISSYDSSKRHKKKKKKCPIKNIETTVKHKTTNRKPHPRVIIWISRAHIAFHSLLSIGMRFTKNNVCNSITQSVISSSIKCHSHWMTYANN
jgi:hypothetical protein